MITIKVTYKINGAIITDKHLITAKGKTKAEQRRNAMADALRYATGYGDEEYYSWDDPDVLQKEIIKMEIVED